MAIQIGQQGWSQQTPAALSIIRSGIGAARSIVRKARSKRRSKASATSTGRKRKKRVRTSSARKSTAARLVKGSAAAKAYMAKIRKKRRK